MTCPHCGTDTPVGAACCAVCGAPQTPATGVIAPVLDQGAATAGVGPFGVTGLGTVAVATGTHQVDLDSTRPLVPGAMHSPTDPHHSPGHSRQFKMLTPGETLGGRYHIIRLLGVGGMGAVYHAWDAELGVAVALKVIRGDITGDSDQAAHVERQFKRELLLARQVTHKHVVRIHDLGDVDGLKYISMPYVQGADLAGILQQSGTLPVPRALAYVKQIVDGLVAAHEAGVIHRDLKPANIMIDADDQALIMDFGIARSPSTSGSGMSKVVGTLAYMAPEQAQAKPTDQRADVYALGMMFREMLVGRTRGDEQQTVAELMQRIKEAPPRVRTIDPAIPEPVDAVIARCLEPDPEKRFQTSAELAAALDALDADGGTRPIPKPVGAPWRLAVAAVLIVAAIAAVTLAVRRTPPSPAKPIDPVSILVADFENKTGDAAFDGALEQPLMRAMEAAAFINAVPRPDARQVAKTLKGAQARLDTSTAQAVASRQGTKYVLAGDVTSKGGGFSVHLRALDPVSSSVVKEASADAATKAGVLSAVGTAAGRLRSALGDKTADAGNGTPADAIGAGSLDAYRELEAADELAKDGSDDAAAQHYRRAIEFDGKSGPAYAGLAILEQRRGNADAAKNAFDTALSLTDRMTDREKYRLRGASYLDVAHDYEKAAENYTALVAAYPGDEEGLINLARAHAQLLDFGKAVEEIRRAVQRNPANLNSRRDLALFAMYAGDFTAAAAESKRLTDAKVSAPAGDIPLAMDAAMKGDIAAASAVYDSMAATGAAGASIASLGKADLALYVGRTEAAESELQAGMAADGREKNTASAALKQVALAEQQLAAGHKAQAVASAQGALELNDRLGIAVLAARVLIRAGSMTAARAVAASLEAQLPKQNRAYGKILLAEIAMESGKYAEAIDLLTQARALADLWLGRFDLGVAYVDRGAFAEGLPELDACQKRRGEAATLFFDGAPTVRYLAPLAYWAGRAEEGLKMASARSRYQAFIDLRKDAPADPLVRDARRRLQ
jgi:Tfp pilus assembly protein PilF